MAKLVLAEKLFILNGIQENMRSDGHGCEDFRSIEIETDTVFNTSGSACMRISNTDVLVGIKAEMDRPSKASPNQGRLEFFVDCSANAAPEFEERVDEELATEIIAVKAALYNTRIPNVTVNMDDPAKTELEVSDDPFDFRLLNVQNSPCLVALSKIGHHHIIDATLEEEACCLVQLIVGVTEQGTYTLVKKEGAGSLDPESIVEIMESAKRVGKSSIFI